MGRSKAGVSLVSVLVGAALVGAGAFLMSELFFQRKVMDERSDRRVIAEQFLMDATNELSNMRFQDFSQECATQPGGTRWGPAPVQGGCLNGAQFRRTGVETWPTVAPANDRRFERRRLATGEYSEAGVFCVELNQCRAVPESELVDFTLTVYWLDPDSRSGASQRQFTMRRGRDGL